MTYMLDTDTVIAFLRGETQAVQAFARHAAGEFVISAMTTAELLLGPKLVRGSRRDEVMAAVRAFLEAVEVLPFDNAAAEVFAECAAELRRGGRNIGDADLIIAATAMARGCTLVTHNQRHFARIETLPCVDWLAP